jgi:hypothetical protein
VLHFGTTRRRVLVGAAVLLALCLVLPFFAIGAGASDVVTNPGNVDVSMSLSLLTFGQNELGIQTLSPARGSIAKDGALTVFGSTITFAPITLSVDVGGATPATIVVDTVSVGDFRGGVDPRSGKTVMRGAILQHWSWQDTPTTCPVGPVFVDATTDAQGARSYTDVTGSATVVDDHVVMNAVAPGTAGCDGLEDVVNAELQLPITTTTTTTTSTAPNAAAQPAGAVDASTSTTAPSTTAAPAAAPGSADASALGAQSPSPPPVPSIVLSLAISPPPSAHGRRSTTTTTPPKVSTTPTTPTVRQPAPPPAPRVEPNRSSAFRKENSKLREQLDAERRKARRALELALAAKKRENTKVKKHRNESAGPSTTAAESTPMTFPSSGGAALPPMTWGQPRKHRNTFSSLHALSARAISSTSTGGWPIGAFVLLVAMAVSGVWLIRSEVRRSRPRHRLRFQSIEQPPDEERADG